MLFNETLDVIRLDAIPLNVFKKVCNSCTIYIVLLFLFLIISICISSAFIYFHWYLKESSTNITTINPSTETMIC